MRQAIDDNTVSSENQVTKSSSEFTLGKEEAGALRLVILGNSITRHGPKPSIGWEHDFGMAASDIEHDYVHLLYKMLAKAGKKPYIFVKQFANWERDHAGRFTDDVSAVREFKPDIIVFRLGENVAKDADKNAFLSATETLLDFIGDGKAKLLMTTCFWHHNVADAVIREFCEKRGITPTELNDLGELPEMKALGLFEHSGVAAHPGDLGMENIATRIFDSLLKLI